MIQHKRFDQLARKWQWIKGNSFFLTQSGAYTRFADKGHCAMYTADDKRFEVPLAYLSTVVFSELLQISKEEFGSHVVAG